MDKTPKLWEEKTALFVAHLIDVKKMQSNTVKSYISAIKRVLMDDNYKWNDNEVLFASFTKACKKLNDKAIMQLPIKFPLLEIILFEVDRYFLTVNVQPFLCALYKALFLLAYYGLMRIGELTKGPHVLKAKDIHLASNKKKLMVILYSSKTHDHASLPQKIKISAISSSNRRHFCLFACIHDYMSMRGNYHDDSDQFLGGLSLYLNHLIGSRVTNYDWPFGTLPLGLFWSNLDTMDLETYPRTYSDHF